LILLCFVDAVFFLIIWRVVTHIGQTSLFTPFPQQLRWPLEFSINKVFLIRACT
jgi:hypothetical protein